MTRETALPVPTQGLDSDSPEVRDVLKGAQERLGFIPNLYARLANSPALLRTYLNGYQEFREHTTLNPAEQEVVFLTISHENGCEYCVAAHSFMADHASHVPAEVTDAIREGRHIDDPRLRTLSQFTRALVKERGWNDKATVDEFINNEFTQEQVLEILLAIGIKTISNYANHLFATPLDEIFQSREWRSRQDT